jgi:hypothetical protein
MRLELSTLLPIARQPDEQADAELHLRTDTWPDNLDLPPQA